MKINEDKFYEGVEKCCYYLLALCGMVMIFSALFVWYK